MAYPNDPIRDRDRDGVVDRNDTVGRRGSGISRTIIIIVVVAIVALAIAWFSGLLKLDTEGALRAPGVEVTGGQVPDVDVSTGNIDVGTRTETIEVPTIDVQKAGEPNAKPGTE